MLACILEMDDRPLAVERPLEKRLVGNCRNFSTMLCAMLQHQGVPARARCGFATYFEPDHFEDHWVCEYWNTGKGRWVMVDAQLDEFQREALKITFDPCDVLRDQFLVGGKAWQMCRQGLADPDKFGIMDMYGVWFVRGNLVRDLVSLNKVEILPWDGWGLISKDEQNISDDDVALLDRVAALTAVDDPPPAEVRALCENDARLRIPPDYVDNSQRFDLIHPGD
jgi:transglutaminase-like putative cysteine protease